MKELPYFPCVRVETCIIFKQTSKNVTPINY